MPTDNTGRGLRWPERLAAAPAPVRLLTMYVAVVLAHATLLRLPYFWDEGGYYVPAALDFYRRGTLIPAFTNAHPPLPNILLALLWRIFGFHILVTRLAACGFAAGGLFAVFELGRRLLGAPAALALTCLTAVYPIWYVQSSLAHADMLAAAFTLGGLALYLTAPESGDDRQDRSRPRRLTWAAGLFCLAVLAKETALLAPVTLAALQLLYTFRAKDPKERRAHRHWALTLCSPIPVLALWFAYHRAKTGFIFGNPTFLRYNATANLTLPHIAAAFWFRFLHLFWQRDIWLPIVLAFATILLPRRTDACLAKALPRRVTVAIAVLLAANWIAFSVLGGALLTRYLLPVYPLTLLLCIALWQSRTAYWPSLAALTAGAFVSALWLNPPTYFAPEDNLTYRDMIVVHEEAIAFLQEHLPDATVLTAWPAAAELTRPELGYTTHPFKVFPVEDFNAAQLRQAANHPGEFDTALVFATHYAAPALRQYLLAHPDSRRGRKYAAERDLSPREIASLLGGRVVWQDDRGGEWAAVLRFDRRYEAALDIQESAPSSAAPPTP